MDTVPRLLAWILLVLTSLFGIVSSASSPADPAAPSIDGRASSTQGVNPNP
jgi:hypothetical protein